MKLFAWPDGVADEIGVSAQTLQARRALGDAPKLFAVSERRLVTTEQALAEWISAKEVPAGYKCRPAVRSGRTKARTRLAESAVGGRAAT